MERRESYRHPPPCHRAHQGVWQCCLWEFHHLVLLHIKYLKFLGDEIPKDDVAKLLDELCDKEDDDGMIPYVPFLERLCGKV
jgi:hypothetical protein